MQPLAGNQGPNISSSVPFFNISSSKSGPTVWCFYHFDLKMCFTTHPRALFRRLNFQKCSRAEALLMFWLGHVLRATAETHLWRSSTSKSAPTMMCLGHFDIGVQFFISHLTRCLRTRRFSEPAFRPSGDTRHWKNTMSRDFSTFSFTCIFFLLTFSLLTVSLLWLLSPRLFHLSILSEVWLLNFLRQPHGGSWKRNEADVFIHKKSILNERGIRDHQSLTSSLFNGATGRGLTNGTSAWTAREPLASLGKIDKHSFILSSHSSHRCNYDHPILPRSANICKYVSTCLSVQNHFAGNLAHSKWKAWPQGSWGTWELCTITSLNVFLCVSPYPENRLPAIIIIMEMWQRAAMEGERTTREWD